MPNKHVFIAGEGRGEEEEDADTLSLYLSLSHCCRVRGNGSKQVLPKERMCIMQYCNRAFTEPLPRGSEERFIGMITLNEIRN
jgi:hypothetical protein